MNDLEISDYNIEADNFKDSKKINTRKLLIISFFMSVIGLVIIMRVLDLSVLYSDKKTIHEKETLSNAKYDRGLLLDRNNKILASNSSDAEYDEGSANWFADFVSNGFKLRNSLGASNSNGASHIYMAFAENPFVTSTGIPGTAR